MLMNVQGNVSFKKTKSVRFSMEDKIIQSKFMNFLNHNIIINAAIQNIPGNIYDIIVY